MKITVRESFLATVAYADIFDYPLTPEECDIWRIRVPHTASRIHGWSNTVTILKKHGKIFYCLRKNKSIIDKLEDRARWSVKKINIAQRMARILRFIPTIRLIGVTGGLAMYNAEKDDDIDIFCIVASGTLWISRFLAVAFMEAFGRRRRPADVRVKDKICLNMFMSESALCVPAQEQDLYTAHEVLQMRVLWERGGVYRAFLRANGWVRNFLPNAWKKSSQFMVHGSQKKFKKKLFKKILRVLLLTINYLLITVEPIAKFAQLWYMQKHRTTEVITDAIIRFHPEDARRRVRAELGKRLNRWNIPLDNIFYGR